MPLLGSDTVVTTPLDKDKPDFQHLFKLETFQGREALGSPYRYDMTLLSTDASVSPDDILGQPLTIRLPNDIHSPRFFHGIVTYFTKLGLTGTHMRYVAIVNPKLSLFDYTRNCLIFKDPGSTAPAESHESKGQTALQIVTEVLANRGFTDVESQSIKDHVYRKREFCVQYRESDLNFVQRLLEEEGIYYFFKHGKNLETMVLADSITAHATVPDYETVPYIPKERRQARDVQHFWSLSVARSLYPNNYRVLRGYDPTILRPHTMLYGTASSAAPQPGKDFEDYDYPGALCLESEANMDACIREQMDHVGNNVIQVEGNTLGLGVGDLVSLEKSAILLGDISPFWSDGDFKKQYLITSATYSISINQAETGDTAGADEPFRATYTLLDSQTPFRPQRTAYKPRIEGPQTAIVVGPHNEEIHTDSFGRVMVVFDWDRVGERFPDAPPSPSKKQPAPAGGAGGGSGPAAGAQGAGNAVGTATSPQQTSQTAPTGSSFAPGVQAGQSVGQQAGQLQTAGGSSQSPQAPTTPTSSNSGPAGQAGQTAAQQASQSQTTGTSTQSPQAAPGGSLTPAATRVGQTVGQAGQQSQTAGTATSSGSKTSPASGGGGPALLSTSCWVRVAQIWAGKGWGGIHLPRIGQEVIVEFLDGDPDRPIIVGRVYNKDNMPPYALPANKTQSGIKSRSSKDATASNFNEIRFEDLKGKEEFHIQAERIMTTLVKASQSNTIQGSRSSSVGGNDSVSVGGNRSVHISGNLSTTVDGGGPVVVTSSTDIDAPPPSIPIECTTKVTGKYDLDVSDTIEIKAKTSITLECGGSKIFIQPGVIQVWNKDNSFLMLTDRQTDTVQLESGKAAKVHLGEKITAKTPDGTTKLSLQDGKAVLESTGKSKLILDGDAKLHGAGKATVEGATEATLATEGGGSVKTSSAGVEATGTMVKLNS